MKRLLSEEVFHWNRDERNAPIYSSSFRGMYFVYCIFVFATARKMQVVSIYAILVFFTFSSLENILWYISFMNIGLYFQVFIFFHNNKNHISSLQIVIHFGGILFSHKLYFQENYLFLLILIIFTSHKLYIEIEEIIN